MSAYFKEGVFSPAGIRRTPEEIHAMEDATERHLLDFELNLLCKDDFAVMCEMGEIPEAESAESADDVLAWFRRVKAGDESEAYGG